METLKTEPTIKFSCPIRVYGIGSLDKFALKDYVKKEVDEGDSVLYTIELDGKEIDVRVVKVAPDVGIAINSREIED